MGAARGVLQRRVRACISRPGILSGRVIYPSLSLSLSSWSSSSSSISTQRVSRTSVSRLRGCALREGRGLPTPVMAGAGSGVSYSTAAGGSEKQVQVQISPGENAEEVRGGLEALRKQGWVLDGEGMGIQKTFYFRTYFKAVSFVNVVASQSAIKKHHPTMTVRIGSVDVHWTTHNPRGLSSQDIAMAQHCEEGAQLMGAVAEEQGKKCVMPSVPLMGGPTR